MHVPFFTFRDFPAGLQLRVEIALLTELRKKQLILGPSVTKFEQEFSQYLGGGNVIGVGNGYDALVLSLRSLGIGLGDEVVVPANGYIATINAVQQVGAKPVFAEPDSRTYNITAATIEPVLSTRTKVILPIHLYGQSCELEGLLTLCKQHGLELVEDFAQAQGALYKGKPVGTFGKVNATSFYPTKNLGAVGDGGAVTTQDPVIAEWVRQYHNYGQSRRYEYAQAGINSRLDSLQAAVLSEKLSFLDTLNTERKRLAALYLESLGGLGDLCLPSVSSENTGHIYHLFVVRTHRRDYLQQFLQEKGVQTLIHYPVPPHLQLAYQSLGYRKGDFPLTEELAATSLSLPLFPGMTDKEQTHVIQQIQEFFL
ncbi:DegT/DnrJ/EryC1/StrS family aminotransferase [Rufibacter latericius]|uniref:DegT/DnrJ/EryC1/StrS family aminotransferase n=1 Tax=Rufibacter latericius TaxID=2487040 RepID=A0A3M9N088_9BACT|nr:DegT/DnrJ/EryC1/StrS family aminotransferase [Rufibacter latericius]RNI31204.1 DegT/DnrJ/EryC1/StrS family aminotransferase [Rufibacter latericius]